MRLFIPGKHGCADDEKTQGHQAKDSDFRTDFYQTGAVVHDFSGSCEKVGQGKNI